MHALSQALNRAMRKLNENTVTLYTNFSMFFIWLAMIKILDQNLGLCLEFNWKEWLFMVSSSVLSVLSAIYNFKATQNLPLPVRQPLNVTGMIYMIIIEVIFFNMEFSVE